MTADSLLSTKFQIPAGRPEGVPRTSLIARLAEGLRTGHRLTLVSAPPGCGKTTLIREWSAVAGRRVAWLTLDEGDNDPALFVRYLFSALDQVVDGRLRRIEAALSGAASAPAPGELLVALINDLADAETDLLLVLDDYHAIRNFAVHDLVGSLLSHQPSRLHVAIVTREDPPLPLARLRARDQLTEVREAALRFTPEETAAFLGQTMRLSLSAGSVASLAARTEGWVTGLQLAALALRQLAGQSADQFVAAFAGDDRFIVDYLMAEVLSREPEPVRNFLRQTSILDQLCAPLCDALTGQDDSQAVLEHLETANLFLAPLDNRREWYRYHVLFAEVLRLGLAPHERIALHQRAAGWLEAHGLNELALHHAHLAAQTKTAAGPARPLPTQKQPLVEPLSERELEVLHLIAAGLSNQEIADRLYIAPGTVKRHINNIFGKLQVGSRTQAVAIARELRIL
jgi:LuxR family maltose regulon positive regulatory protein